MCENPFYIFHESDTLQCETFRMKKDTWGMKMPSDEKKGKGFEGEIRPIKPCSLYRVRQHIFQLARFG